MDSFCPYGKLLAGLKPNCMYIHLSASMFIRSRAESHLHISSFFVV